MTTEDKLGVQMNKWILRAILLNALFILAFIYFDYYTWTVFPANLASINCSQGTPQTVEVFSDTAYNIFFRNFNVRALQRYGADLQFGQWYSQSSSTPNFPLVLFMVTIAVNLYLMWSMTAESRTRVIEP